MNRLTQTLALIAIGTSLWSQSKPVELVASSTELTATSITLVDKDKNPRMRIRVNPISGAVEQEFMDARGRVQAMTKVGSQGGVDVNYGHLKSGILGARPVIELRVEESPDAKMSSSLLLDSSSDEYGTYFTSNPDVGAMGVLGSLEKRCTVMGVGTAKNGLQILDKGMTRIEASQNGLVTGIALADKKGAVTFGSAVEDKQGRFAHYAQKPPGEQLWNAIQAGVKLKAIMDQMSK